MSAFPAQVLEPPGNVVRLGTENASQIQRKAPATAQFDNPGRANLITANTPAIPWTSSTGFSNGVTPPTTPGTIDFVGSYSRWVTFILAGANLSTQPMYVCKVADWPALAGPAGGRTVVPLDVWELHSWHYCGREFAIGLDLLQHGTYTFTTSDIPANTDTATHTVTYPLTYAAGVVPDVLASSHDVGWIASAEPTSGLEQTQINISLSRRIPLTNSQTDTKSLTFPSGASSYVYPSNPVLFPTAYDGAVTPTPVVVLQTNHPDFVAVPSGVTTTGFNLAVHYRPNLSTGSVGAPSPDQSSDNATDSSGMRGVGTGAPVSPIETQLAYSKVAGADGAGGTGTSAAGGTGNTGVNGAGANHAHTENTAAAYAQNATTATNSNTHAHTGPSHTHGVADDRHKHTYDDHVHNLNNHHHTLGAHTHPYTGATTLTGSSVALTIVYESFGQRAAPAVSKLCTWTAIGLGTS
jgi:hypothetical protein